MWSKTIKKIKKKSKHFKEYYKNKREMSDYYFVSSLAKGLVQYFQKFM